MFGLAVFRNALPAKALVLHTHFWLPDLGDEQTIDCAACGWTVTLAVGTPTDT
jgi:hypothetical protein